MSGPGLDHLSNYQQVPRDSGSPPRARDDARKSRGCRCKRRARGFRQDPHSNDQGDLASGRGRSPKRSGFPFAGHVPVPPVSPAEADGRWTKEHRAPHRYSDCLLVRRKMRIRRSLAALPSQRSRGLPPRVEASAEAASAGDLPVRKNARRSPGDLPRAGTHGKCRHSLPPILIRLLPPYQPRTRGRDNLPGPTSGNGGKESRAPRPPRTLIV